MISRDGGNIIINCDGCSEDYDTGESDFRGAIEEIKEVGWRIGRNEDDSDWVHFCPSCREELFSEKKAEF